jgi:hypothetical protein
LFWSFFYGYATSTPDRQHPYSPDDQRKVSSDQEDILVKPHHGNMSASPPSGLLAGIISRIMTPPTIAVIAAVLIGIFPPVKRLFYGDSAPFHSVEYLQSVPNSIGYPCP